MDQFNVRDGWICDGPRCDGEARSQTFVCWLDLADLGRATFGQEGRGRNIRDCR
jgi:hypothetical protein